jgi:hypothetical protein
MKGINLRLVYAFLFTIFVIVITNYNYFFGKKVVTEPSPGPAPGPSPEEEEEEEEEEEVPRVGLVTEQLTMKPEIESKTSIVTEIKAIDKLPMGIVKKETYIGYSDI